ncbi:sterigmatocystin biosynthesis P450 monooxygenase stcS-like protein 3 [Seiridium cupressi]
MFELFLIAAGTLLASYFYTKVRYMRNRQYARIPQLPNHLLWGHLKTLGEFMSRGIHDRHPGMSFNRFYHEQTSFWSNPTFTAVLIWQIDKIFEEMWESMGRPPIMLVDLRPINPPMVLVPNHSIAEQISKPSKERHQFWAEKVQDWKHLRKRFNPGFTARHLWNLLPLILEKMEPFCNYLDQFTDYQEEFSLERIISNLTFDVIGAAVMEVQLDAQHLDHLKQSEVIRLFRDLVQTYSDDQNNLPWWIVPLTTWRRIRLAKHIDSLVKRMIQQKYNEVKEEASGNRSRSILALSFQDTEILTPKILSDTSGQVRSFLFAGHDTNTSMLQWAFYELSRTLRALKAVREEPDEILGPQTDPRMICAALAQDGENLLPHMHYINAVIKETLRLHPPASTVRMTDPGTGFKVCAPTGEEYMLDGLIMYSCQSIIHRDSAVYGDTADDWVPERWLGDAVKSIPVSAWRPCERGPRSCIGLELANLESRVIIAIVARKYDFIKTGLGESARGENGLPFMNDRGQYQARSELYNDDISGGGRNNDEDQTRGQAIS